MNLSYYKYCIVPQCKSTTIKTPNKLFVYVPNKKQIRKKWLKLARRADVNSLSTTSRMYFCEDHFDMPNDMDNYFEYHIMGTVSQVRMKPGCTPRKFECQVKKKRPYVFKNKKTKTIAECKNEPEKSCTSFIKVVPISSLKDTSDRTSESKTKVSAEQTSILCSFFEDNPEVIRGYKRTPKCKEEVQNKWKDITPHLNAAGPPRDHKSWAKYVCDMKAKLKKKNIQWRYSCDGKDPIMCNTDDFNEISLRMIQVLRSDVTQGSQDSTNLETEDGSNVDDNLGESENGETNTLPEEIPDVKPKLECFEQNNFVTNTIQYNTPAPSVQAPHFIFGDDFDNFGKKVAGQLRTLPLLVALDTQEMLLSVLKKQRQKVLSRKDPLKT